MILVSGEAIEGFGQAMSGLERFFRIGDASRSIWLDSGGGSLAFRTNKSCKSAVVIAAHSLWTIDQPLVPMARLKV